MKRFSFALLAVLAFALTVQAHGIAVVRSRFVVPVQPVIVAPVAVQAFAACDHVQAFAVQQFVQPVVVQRQFVRQVNVQRVNVIQRPVVIRQRSLTIIR